MPRKPLELGNWGSIRTYPTHVDKKGNPDRYRSSTYFRDFDGHTRPVHAFGPSKTAAENNLKEKVINRRNGGQSTTLTGSDKFSKAAAIWMEKFEQMVKDGKRSAGSLDTYRCHLERTVLPSLGELRLGELNTPVLDKVVCAIRDDVGPATARSCRTIISGIVGVAIRFGAIPVNPVRDVERIEGQPKKKPRALTASEREAWFNQIRTDPGAMGADLPDLTTFMLGTGVRIGESLGLLWSQVDLATGKVEISHQVIRATGQGLIRVRTKSRAGERVLMVPTWCLIMLQARAGKGVSADQPVFADSKGGFRDPSNVNRDLRKARSPIGSRQRRGLSRRLRRARRDAGLTQAQATARLGWKGSRLSLIERARLRLTVEDAEALLTLYRVREPERTELRGLVEDASKPIDADAFSWLTSHVFRKTTATLLDDAGQSARQIADQLGHARPSMTQDVYMGRKAKNPGAATALEHALGEDPEPNPTP
jgi:integrase